MCVGVNAYILILLLFICHFFPFSANNTQYGFEGSVVCHGGTDVDCVTQLGSEALSRISSCLFTASK